MPAHATATAPLSAASSAAAGDCLPELFNPLRLGELVLPNRMIMAPMTRARANDRGTVGPLTATYYAQRAGAGLIISEGTFPSWMGKGYVRTPGLACEEHVRAWRAVTAAVHAAGGRMFVQLMHAGRISHPQLLPGGATPVAPSAVRPEGHVHTDHGPLPWPTPRALTRAEISGVIAEYVRSAERAFAAGFDGVEFHAASGYLPEQFLSSRTNRRTDDYGGSVAGRMRFVLEGLDALSAVRGPGRVGIKLGPELNINDIADDTPRETYGQLMDALAGRGLAYVHVTAAGPLAHYHTWLRPRFDGPYLAGGGFTPERGAALLARSGADAIVIGAPFIANPDLTERVRRGRELSSPDRSTFYTPGPVGYTDYPVLQAMSAGENK